MQDACSSGGGEPTAFRAAEKAYQLHLDQQIRTRKDGRRCGGKLVARPTDFSRVLDLHGAAAVHHVGYPVELPALEAGEADPLSPACGVAIAYTLPAHPGLVMFTSAVPARQQLRLMQAALTQYPEPPAHTNHSAAYGPLVGLFAAAQGGLACKVPHAAAGGPAAGPCSAAPGPPGQGDSGAADAAGELAAGQAASTCPPSCSEPGSSAGGCAAATERGGSSGGTAGASGRTFADCWSEPSGGGGGRPPASTLLRKLRWACLGPNFDWTRRVYDSALPHRPLPAELALLARRFYGAALEILHEHGQPLGAHQLAGSFRPDAAIVNYYREGDTLNGHADDAEADLAKPIVTVSLGCDAIFLIGGPTRDQEPTALRLCSGDVVVMGGPARRCYHGLPRILASCQMPSTGTCSTANPWMPWGLPAAAAAVEAEAMGAGAGGAEQAALVRQCWEAMQASRVNISIRETG